jgi:hypothetical protein
MELQKKQVRAQIAETIFQLYEIENVLKSSERKDNLIAVLCDELDGLWRLLCRIKLEEKAERLSPEELDKEVTAAQERINEARSELKELKKRGGFSNYT